MSSITERMLRLLSYLSEDTQSDKEAKAARWAKNRARRWGGHPVSPRTARLLLKDPEKPSEAAGRVIGLALGASRLSGKHKPIAVRADKTPHPDLTLVKQLKAKYTETAKKEKKSKNPVSGHPGANSLLKSRKHDSERLAAERWSHLEKLRASKGKDPKARKVVQSLSAEILRRQRLPDQQKRK